MFPPHHLVPLPGLLYYGTFFSSHKIFFFVLCKEQELACFIMFSSRYCSRSFFLFSHQQPSTLTSICSLLAQLLMCSIFTAFSLSHLPSSLLEGGNVAVRTHIPYSPTPVRSASIIIFLCRLYSSLSFSVVLLTSTRALQLEPVSCC